MSRLITAGILLALLPTIGFAEDRKAARTLATPGEVKWLAFTPDGKALLTASARSGRGNADGHELRLWEVATGKLLVGPVQSDRVSASGAISPDGKTAVTGSSGGAWQLWSLPDFKPGLKGQLLTGRVHRLAFAPDGKTFAALRADYRRSLFDPIKASRVTYSGYTFYATTGKPVGEPQAWPRELWKGEKAKDPRPSNPAGWSLGMSPAFGKDGRPVLPTAAETVALQVPDDNESCGGPAACAISPDRKRAVSSGCNGQIILWDYQKGTPIGDPVAKVENLQVLDNGLIFAPKSDRFAVVQMVPYDAPRHYRPVIRVYDASSRKAVGEPAKPGRTSLLDAMAFSPDGETLAVSFRLITRDGVPGDNEIQLWKITPAR